MFGNLDQTRENLISTKSEQLALEMKNYFSQIEKNNHCVFADIGLANPDPGKIYTYLLDNYQSPVIGLYNICYYYIHITKMQFW